MRTSIRTSTFSLRAMLFVAALALATTAVSWGSPPQSDELSPPTARPRPGAAARVAPALPGAEARASRQAPLVGGIVGTRLAIVNGFSAKVPAAAVPKLRR